LASGPLKLALLTDMEKDLLLKAYKIDIKSDFAEDILAKAPPEMRKELEKNLFFLLEQKVTEMLIEQDALSMGIVADPSRNEMLKAYFGRITDGIIVTEAEMRAFYEANKEMLGNMSFDQVKGEIEPFLLEQKKIAALDGRIENLGKRTNIHLNRNWMKEQVRMARDNPVDRARMSGKPSLIQFGAAGCPPCDMMRPILDKLKKEFPDKLQVVYVNVRENQLLGSRFGVRATPTQIFFDKDGKEVSRHEGFMSEADIDQVFKEMGVS
jgi:thiol-disulfide isomerase/thioredoxin